MSDDFNDLLLQARRRMGQGDYAGALDLNDRLVSRYPRRPFTWLQRTRILLGMDAYREALRCVLESSRLNPVVSEVSVHHVKLLSTFHLHRAVDLFHAGLSDQQRAYVPLLVAFAEIYTYRNKLDQAMQCLNAAMCVAPDSMPLLFMRGRIRVFQGSFEAAISDFNRCIEIDPLASGPYWFLSRIPGSQDRAGEIRAIVSKGSLAGRDLVAMLFAKHHYEHREGLYGNAEAALREACRLQRGVVSYSEVESDAVLESLKSLPLQRSSLESDIGDRTPIFIVGMHRSGTTLLEYLLSKDSRVYACGEIYDFPESLRIESDHNMNAPVDLTTLSKAGGFDMRAVGDRYLSSAGYLSDNAKFFTDKLPSNYMNIGFIAEALPRAKIIHVSRSPVETCFSNLRELFSDQTNTFSYDASEMARQYNRYANLMEHWSNLYGQRILDVKYEQMVSDPVTTVASIQRFCGITNSSVESSSLLKEDAVSTASAFKVRGAVARPDVADWECYAEFMAPVVDILDRNSFVGAQKQSPETH